MYQLKSNALGGENIFALTADETYLLLLNLTDLMV